jgi:exo-1,4-beta-D-glucosaminidase
VLWCTAVEVTVGQDLYRPLRKYVKELDPTRPFIPASSIWWDWEKLTPYIEDDLPLGMTDHYDPDYTWKPETFFFNKVLEVKWQQFRNELGVPSVPTLSSLKKFINNLGEDKNNTLFPLDSVWAHHGAWDGNGYAFKAYHNAIKSIYGFNSTNVSDYVNIAQLVNYNSYRAMFESYQHRMWDITNGVMLWKLNSCWPSVLWQIYDWYLNPNAAYYATKKACEPIHIQMNAHDFQVSVINTSNNVLRNFKVTAKIYDFNLKLRWEREEVVNIGEDRYQEVFSVPQLSKITPVYFVKLELRDEEGKLISSNFYWESSKTPADLSDLARLSEVKPDLSYEIEEREKEYVINVKINNSTDNLSFFNRLAIIKNNNGEEVLPTFWEDNFITLLPSEERTLEARFAKEDLGDSAFSVVIDNNR